MENYKIDHELEKMNMFSDIRDYKSSVTFNINERPVAKFVTDFYALYHYFSTMFDENEPGQIFEFNDSLGTTTMIIKEDSYITFEVSQVTGEITGELYFCVVYCDEFKRFIEGMSKIYDEVMEELVFEYVE